jgi:UDP-N-acetylmuramate dehydrogenase
MSIPDVLIKFLKPYSKLELQLDHNFKSDTTMRLESYGNLLVARDILELAKLITFLSDKNIAYRVLGWGANQVIPSGTDVLWLKLDLPFESEYFNQRRDEYVLPASVRLSHLTRHAVEFFHRGWEVFTGIPATLGGAVFMNAGTRLGEIGSLVTSIKKINTMGEIEHLQIDKSLFSYRKNHFVDPGEIIIEATLKAGVRDESVAEEIKKYLSKRNETQPMNKFTCGCVFKNPENDSAGRLIEVCGLKGLTENGVRVSHKHGNFFENFNNGTIEDFYKLSKKVQDEIELQFGIKLEFEVELNL